MTVQTEVSEVSPVEVEVKVDVPWDLIKKELEASFKTLARNAKVRGFRPGKVPTKVVRKLYGPQVESEVTGTFVERGLMAAVEQHSIAIIAEPKVEEPILTKGEGLKFTAKIEVQPTIEKVETADLKIQHAPTKVEDKDIDESLEALRKQHSDLIEPEPMRGATKQDVLTLDFAVRVEDELKPELGADDREVDLAEDGLIDEFVDGLLGMKPGDSKNISVTFPEDNPREELAGKPAVFEVSIKELKERLLPDLDDDLAQDVGDFETLDALKADIRSRLEKQAEHSDESAVRELLIDAVLEKNEVPVPPTMLQKQKQQMMMELFQFVQMTGQQVDPSLFDGMDERAERRVKAGLLLGALARTEKIEVTGEEVDQKLAAIAEDTGKHIAKVKVEYTGERRDQLENQLLEEKLVAFLKSKATIDETPVEKSAEDGASK